MPVQPVRRDVAHLFVLAAILILAAILRFNQIGAQSLWYDEGNSARIAERSAQLIVEGAAGDIHPPLYYLLLKAWRAAFGPSEAGLRSFSAACGVLTVLFAYLIGRDLFGRRAGLIAAFLLAIAPFAVYYAQEARMYALLALCAAASTWAVLSFSLRSPNPRSKAVFVVLYVLATAAGLWTHYAYPFVMAAQAACVAGFLVFDGRPTVDHDRESADTGRKSLVIYLASTLAAVVLFLPWAPIAVRQVLGWGVEREAYSLGPAALDAYRAIVVGRTLPPEAAAVPVLTFSVAALLGLLLPSRLGFESDRRRSLIGRLAMLTMAALPMALLFLVGLYRESYLKFLLVSVLPLCALAGRGVVALAARVSAWATSPNPNTPSRAHAALAAVLALALAALFAPSLANMYGDPAYARDDYRGIHARISAGARPDDAVIFIAPNQWEVYTYYQGDDRGLFPVAYRPATYDQVARQLEAIAAGHERLFVLYFGERDADPEGWYESWLGNNAFKAGETWSGDVRLATYHRPVADGVLREGSAGARFGDAIALDGARGAFGDAAAGDVIPVELTWRAEGEIASRYAGFVHIGPPDAAPVAQNDGEPAAGYRPTDTWAPGERVVDRRGAWIPPGTPPGTYGVYVGLYDPATGARLPISRDGNVAGDRLQIGAVTIR